MFITLISSRLLARQLAKVYQIDWKLISLAKPPVEKLRDNDIKIPPKINTDAEEIKSDDILQSHWLSLERRVAKKQPKKVGEGPQGRTLRRSSAWDAENV